MSLKKKQQQQLKGNKYRENTRQDKTRKTEIKIARGPTTRIHTYI